MLAAPTPTALRVLGVIATAIRQQGYPPTMREICKVFGWRRTNAAWEHVVRLRRHGMLDPVGDTFAKSRCLRVTAAGYAALSMDPPTLPRGGSPNSTARVVPIRPGWRCANGGCNAMTFDTSKPCPMCALAHLRSA